MARWNARSAEIWVRQSPRAAARRISTIPSLERGHVTVRLHGRFARRELLERRPYREDRQKLAVVDRTDARSAKRLGLDEAKELEVAKRLAHRRLARAELPRKSCLDEALTRLELAAQDPLEEDLLDLLAEDGTRDRHRVTVTASPRDDRIREGAKALDLDRHLVAGPE